MFCENPCKVYLLGILSKKLTVLNSLFTGMQFLVKGVQIHVLTYSNLNQADETENFAEVIVGADEAKEGK